MKEEGILLTIVIPVYNINSKLLDASLKSVIDNKKENVEIIIVDDGSTNGAGEICDEYKNELNNVYVYHQINQGVSVARNRGIEEARGDYIAFVDSDDEISMSTLLRIAEYANEKKLDICFYKYRRDNLFENCCEDLQSAGIQIKDKNELVYNIASQNEPYDGYCIGSPWGKVFKKEFIGNNELQFSPSLRKMQDRVFMMYCLMKKPLVDFVPVEAYCYVLNEESIVNRYNKNIGKYLANVAKEICEFNNHYEIFSKKQLNTILCKLLNEYLGLDIMHRNNPNSMSQKANQLKRYIVDNGFQSALNEFNIAEFDKNARIKLWLIKKKLYKLLLVFGVLNSKLKNT